MTTITTTASSLHHHDRANLAQSAPNERICLLNEWAELTSMNAGQPPRPDLLLVIAYTKPGSVRTLLDPVPLSALPARVIQSRIPRFFPIAAIHTHTQGLSDCMYRCSAALLSYRRISLLWPRDTSSHAREIVLRSRGDRKFRMGDIPREEDSHLWWKSWGYTPSIRKCGERERNVVCSREKGRERMSFYLSRAG